MNWIQILKLDQVNIAETTLDTRPLPDEDRDCCEEARIFYMVETGKYIIRKLKGIADSLNTDHSRLNLEWASFATKRHGPHWATKFDENNDEDCMQAYTEEHGGTGLANKRNLLGRFDCDSFREQLGRQSTKSSLAALKLWEECERG
tara:strand:- start:331 stop:771 length:441 start_codon:yes stop_codon:yes gene_type:complete